MLLPDPRTGSKRHGDPFRRPVACPYDAEEFRQWLASLPPSAVLPVTEEPFINWLRANGDPHARMVQDADGSWRDFVYRGVRDEVPGSFSYWYDQWEPGWTVEQIAAAFDAYMREWREECKDVWPW